MTLEFVLCTADFSCTSRQTLSTSPFYTLTLRQQSRHLLEDGTRHPGMCQISNCIYVVRLPTPVLVIIIPTFVKHDSCFVLFYIVNIHRNNGFRLLTVHQNIRLPGSTYIDPLE